MLEAAKQPAIANVFSVPGRFLRSVQLEKDFLDEAALEGYIVTPPVADALQQILGSLRTGSKRRAWRITGDYGVGKSSMALVLARLLSGSESDDSRRIAARLGLADHALQVPLLPVLITGSRESIPSAVARGVRESLGHPSAAGLCDAKLEAALEALEASASVRAIEQFVSLLIKRATECGKGVLLIIDELGKLLEYAAMHPDHEDVFALQRLAEMAARSTAAPFLLLGILHQGFQAYAERLPLSLRHEWDKVAGRFEEIVFDQPLIHTSALAAGALGVAQDRLPQAVLNEAADALTQAADIGWIGVRGTGFDPVACYPLHPALLPVMVRFFARFGQSERSLFGFLLSSETGGLQAFASQNSLGQAWFDAANFYDYVRGAFGHKISAASYQTHWLRIVATVDAANDVTPLELKVLKTVGLLNLLDSDDLLPTARNLIACLSLDASGDIQASIETLSARGLLFKRGGAGAFRLWPSSSINLNATVHAAGRAIGEIEAVAPAVAKTLQSEMVLARRHYLETGTMRYFELRYAVADEVEKVLAQESAADGVIVIALSDQPEHIKAARNAGQSAKIANDPSRLIAIAPPIWHLASYLRDVLIWQWVETNSPELADDDFASAEVRRQIVRARHALASQFDELMKLGRQTRLEWIYNGAPFEAAGNLPMIVSQLCSKLYPLSPRVTNELINRNVLSSAAASARMRLIEGIFKAPDKPMLGMDEAKSPPEKSMYLSVLKKGGLHVADGDGFRLQIPSPTDDILHLNPSLAEILSMIRHGRGCRIAITDILRRLSDRPYGVRDGLAPVLLATVLKVHAHELALYEHGTFLPTFGSMEFLRLIKAPQTFEVQHCSVEGVRSEVFSRLATLFAAGINRREPVLLDVVTQLSQFAANLPEFTRKVKALSPTTIAVRDALLSAREPATLLFADLPHACGLPIFRIDETNDVPVDLYIERLGDAIGELRNAYSDLIKRVVRHTSEAIGQDPERFDRVALASRGARVSLAAREPRLRAFALRLRDPALHDEAWAESLASFVVSKPPARWLPGDEARFTEEIGALAEVFAKVESTAFSSSQDRPNTDAIRLNLTRGDGQDLVKVLHPVELDQADKDALKALAIRLPQGENQRIQILANLLWDELSKVNRQAPTGETQKDVDDVRNKNDR